MRIEATPQNRKKRGNAKSKYTLHFGNYFATLRVISGTGRLIKFDTLDELYQRI